MQRKQSRIDGVKVGGIGVASHEQCKRLGVDWVPGSRVVAAFPVDLSHSWSGWEPGCELIQVPGFPRHIVLAATHRRTSLYIIAHVDEPGVRQGLHHLCSEGKLSFAGIAGFYLFTPRQVEYLVLGRHELQVLGELLRDSVQPAPRCLRSLTPPVALLEQIPDLFKKQCREARRSNKHVAMYLFGDELLYGESLQAVIASPEAAK